MSSERVDSYYNPVDDYGGSIRESQVSDESPAIPAMSNKDMGSRSGNGSFGNIVAGLAYHHLPYVRKELSGYVGFHNLPNQVHRKSVKKGFYFTFMIVGESGLGKSTLINSLFNATLHEPKNPDELESPKAVDISIVTADLEEDGVNLHLTVIDTPGFGDFINNDDCWNPIVDTIEKRFEAFYEQENRVDRTSLEDLRVHACIYFIAPSGHSLTPLDLTFMKRLCKHVNLIPIIAKSDTMGEEELAGFKARILQDLKANDINYYTPFLHEMDDAETLAETKDVMSRIPFAVVGSEKILEINGKQMRGRQYPWGAIEVENEDHCDFVKLRQMFIRTHMLDLQDHTNKTLYENYRSNRSAKEIDQSLENKFEVERSLHEAKLIKMENEMKAVFQQKVAEKETRLKQSEDELYARHREMKEQLDRQHKELEVKKKMLESGGRGSTGTSSSLPGDSKKGFKGMFNK